MQQVSIMRALKITAEIFLAKNLKITGMMQGNFIGINNSGKFAADNIDIQAVSESGSM